MLFTFFQRKDRNNYDNVYRCCYQTTPVNVCVPHTPTVDEVVVIIDSPDGFVRINLLSSRLFNAVIRRLDHRSVNP